MREARHTEVNLYTFLTSLPVGIPVLLQPADCAKPVSASVNANLCHLYRLTDLHIVNVKIRVVCLDERRPQHRLMVCGPPVRLKRTDTRSPVMGLWIWISDDVSETSISEVPANK